MMTMDVTMYGNQQQTYPESYCQTDYPPEHGYYADSHYHHYQEIPGHDHQTPPVTQDHPDPIINTDNGLSYTNLDYASIHPGQAYPQHNLQGAYPADMGHYPNIPHLDANHQSHHHHHHKLDNHYLETKYNMHFIEGEATNHNMNNYPHIVMHQSGSPNSCLDYQGHYQGKSEHMQDLSAGKDMHHGGDCFRQQEIGARLGGAQQQQGLQNIPGLGPGPGMGLGQGPGTGQHNQHHHAVPTYKWMQVKRNVPKPAGEYYIGIIHINIFLN